MCLIKIFNFYKLKNDLNKFSKLERIDLVKFSVVKLCKAAVAVVNHFRYKLRSMLDYGPDFKVNR